MLPGSPALFGHEAAGLLQEAFPVFQKPYLYKCPWAPTYFQTTCDGTTFARYLYATDFGGGTVFATGTRREAQQNIQRCLSSGAVPYDPEQEDWAFRQVQSLWSLRASEVERLENYTACFPTTMDGQPYVRALKCAAFPKVFVVNGLAGGGIARGPGAGQAAYRLVVGALHGGAVRVSVWTSLFLTLRSILQTRTW